VTDPTPKQRRTGVWCNLCQSNFAATEAAVVAHYEWSHGRKPLAAELQKVLHNTFRKKFSRKMSGTNGGMSAQAEAEHEWNWNHVIQGGSPGSGRRR
jgi:hypothetical protein